MQNKKKVCLFSDNFLQHNEHKTFYCFDAFTFFVFALNYRSRIPSLQNQGHRVPTNSLAVVKYLEIVRKFFPVELYPQNIEHQKSNNKNIIVKTYA